MSARGKAARRKGCAVLVLVLSTGLLASCTSVRIRHTDLYRQYFDEPARAPNPSVPYTYEKRGTTHVFSLYGDEYAMGHAYGEAARGLGVGSFYDEVFANAARMLAEEVPAEFRGRLTVPLAKRLLRDAWARMEPHVPPYALRLLAGFADGSGLDIADVHAMHAIPDFSESSCSALWATGSATADGSTLQVRVLDYIMGLGIQREPAVVFLHFADGHTVANIRWLGLLGVISGMNDRGLAVSEMGTGDPAGENFHGIPMPFLLLDILRWCDDPAEAAGIIRSHPRTASYAYIVGSARNGALAFTTDPARVSVFRPGQRDAPVPQFADSLHAGHYAERMTALLGEALGRVSIEWLATEYLPAIAMTSNLQCVIYDLEKGRFLVANAPDASRRAADQAYVEFSFPPAASAGTPAAR